MFKVYLVAYTNDIISPSETMGLMNELTVDTFPEGKFISLFYLIIHEDTGKISYCKAAQEPGLHMKNNGEIDEMVTKGQVLGLFSANDFPELVSYEENEIELERRVVACYFLWRKL